MVNILGKILGDPNDRLAKKFKSTVEEINSLEPELERLSEDELRARTGELKELLQQGEELDDLLPEAFAVVREAARRSLGERHYDVQLVGGMVLHNGGIGYGSCSDGGHGGQ